MFKVSCLGPSGTYCSLALKKYFKEQNYSVIYKDTISEVLSLSSSVDAVIVPYENSLDGYVIEVIDKLLESNAYISESITLPIDFTFISNRDLKNTSNLYVQFKARKQCLNFLKKYNLSFTSTESNVSSFNYFAKDESYGAIVPSHLVKEDYKTKIEHISDNLDNYTRFIVIKKDLPILKEGLNLVTVSIKSKNDKPGLLLEILNGFKENNINIRSIMSRPTKDVLGSYNFFMEFDIYKENYQSINNLIEKLNLNNDFEVKILGICQE